MEIKKTLRSEFTNTVYKLLEEGRSLNLISRKGEGSNRLLEDICQVARSEGVIVYHADIKRYKHDYKGLLSILNPNSTYESNENNLPAILNKNIVRTSKYFLLLDNFDSILDDKEQRYPKSFFDDLNSIRNIESFSVLLVTEKAHNQYNIYYLDEKGQLENNLSWLDLMLVYLPALEQFEIRDELNRILINSEGWGNEQRKEDFVLDIYKNSGGFNTYTLLKLYSDEFLMNPKFIQSDIRISKVRDRLRKDVNRVPKSIFSWDNIVKKIKDCLDIFKSAKEVTE